MRDSSQPLTGPRSDTRPNTYTLAGHSSVRFSARRAKLLVWILVDRALNAFSHSLIDIFCAKQFWRRRLLHLKSWSIPASATAES